MNCRKVKRLIESLNTEDLNVKKDLYLEKHLSSCEDCSKLFNKYKTLHFLSSRLRNDVENRSLSKISKDRIISSVISEMESRGFMPPFVYNKYSIAAAFIAISLVLMVSLPLLKTLFEKSIPDRNDVLISERQQINNMEKKSIFESKEEQYIELEAKKVNGTIALAWKQKDKKTYKISRSISPKDFSNAYTVLVAGNQWVDPIKNRSNIVFYKIE